MAMPQKALTRITAAMWVTLMLAGCGHRDQKTQGTTGSNAESDVDSAALPQPQTSGGSITGMPDKPGPAQAISTIQPLTPATSNVGDGAAASPGNLNTTVAGTGVATVEMAPAATGSASPSPFVEPTPQDAVAVIHDYYSAINRNDFVRAWALWADRGHASGQTPQQFADGYSDTDNVNVQTQAPERLDAAAGSRYIEIPVSITASRRDGSEHHYTGTYTLRRAMVDGATADQRTWRITTANLRETSP